jgi:hypothetical protein
MFPDGAFGRYLYKRGVLLKDAGKFFESESEVLIQHAKRAAEQAGRPYRYLESAHTHASGQSKEAMAPGHRRARRGHRRPGVHLLGARTLCLIGRRG